MSGSLSTDRKERVEALALRVALSPSFQAFFNSEATPDEWALLVDTWDEDTMHTMNLILDEEDSMRKDLATETLRKKSVNKAALLQKLEQSRVAAHMTNTPDHD
jgi:hypothetical protein